MPWLDFSLILMELRLDLGSRETLLVNDETKNLLRIYERYQALLAATIVAPGHNMYQDLISLSRDKLGIP